MAATNSPRYLCSHLVTLTWDGQSRVVNLEEICTTGALLESDEPVAAGVSAELRSGAVAFLGTVTEVDQHEYGWHVEMEFSPMTPWSLEKFVPEHLLDPGAFE